jgi:hypothetical protein
MPVRTRQSSAARWGVSAEDDAVAAELGGELQAAAEGGHLVRLGTHPLGHFGLGQAEPDPLLGQGSRVVVTARRGLGGLAGPGLEQYRPGQRDGIPVLVPGRVTALQRARASALAC